jgi:hypothetical protein
MGRPHATLLSRDARCFGLDNGLQADALHLIWTEKTEPGRNWRGRPGSPNSTEFSAGVKDEISPPARITPHSRGFVCICAQPVLQLHPFPAPRMLPIYYLSRKARPPNSQCPPVGPAWGLRPAHPTNSGTRRDLPFSKRIPSARARPEVWCGGRPRAMCPAPRAGSVL